MPPKLRHPDTGKPIESHLELDITAQMIANTALEASGVDVSAGPAVESTDTVPLTAGQKMQARIAHRTGNVALAGGEGYGTQDHQHQAMDERRTEEGQQTGAEQTGFKTGLHAPVKIPGEPQEVADQWFDDNKVKPPIIKKSSPKHRGGSARSNTAAKP